MHSLEFVDRTSGVHTQITESYWNRIKKLKGVHSHQLSSYLDEFMAGEVRNRAAVGLLRVRPEQ